MAGPEPFRFNQPVEVKLCQSHVREDRVGLFSVHSAKEDEIQQAIDVIQRMGETTSRTCR
jgi:hypothetical protein